MQRGYETTGKLWEKARSSVKSGEGAKITYLLSSGGCVTMVRRWASPSLQDAPCFHASKQHASRSLSENGKYAKNDQEGLKRSYHSFMSLEDFWKTFGRLWPECFPGLCRSRRLLCVVFQHALPPALVWNQHVSQYKTKVPCTLKGRLPKYNM